LFQQIAQIARALFFRHLILGQELFPEVPKTARLFELAPDVGRYGIEAKAEALIWLQSN
jgi:hypothetical protein